MKQIMQLNFAVVTAIVMMILAACGAAPAKDENQIVADMASKIAEFDIPAGYTPELGIHMLGYSLVSYKGTSGPSHMYLIQSENKKDETELQKMLDQLIPGSSDANTRMTVVDNFTATVRGQEAAVIISEGTNSDQVAYRQATVAFQGKGGPALLVFSESSNAWDRQALDALLASIK